MLKVATFFLCVYAVSAATHWWDVLGSSSCHRIQATDCYKYGDHKECGTDGVTYRNRCDFSKAHCENSNLHVYAYSACADITFPPGGGDHTGPTTTNAPILSGQEAVLDILCVEISHDNCGTEVQPICGTDLKTYDNSCEFQKAKCTHRNLHITDYGACPV